MVVVWRDPPERPPRANAVFTAELLEELRAEPGRWALVRVYRNHKGSSRVKHPADIELLWSVVGGRARPAAELYARARPCGS